MKRYVRSYTEPSASRYAAFLKSRNDKIADRFDPFSVRDAHIDRWSANKLSYRITLGDDEWIAYYNDVDRYEAKAWNLYGEYNPGQIKDSMQIKQSHLYTDKKFSGINEIMTFLFQDRDV